MLFSQRDNLGQALGLDRANKSLRVGIQIRASCGKLHCFDARGFQSLAKRPCEQRISIVDEVASFLQKPLVAISEISCDLTHPLAIGPSKDPGNLDSTTLEVEDEENEIPNQAPSA